MKNIRVKGLIILSLALTLEGCMPDDDSTYDGPTVVEFKNHTLGFIDEDGALTSRGIVQDDPSLGQTDLSRAIYVNSDVVDTIYVQLVGPQVSADTQVSFSISSESTAVEGENYTLIPQGTRTVTIPANSSVGYILTKPIANSIADDEDPKSIIYELDLNQTPKPSANYSSFTLTLAP